MQSLRRIPNGFAASGGVNSSPKPASFPQQPMAVRFTRAVLAQLGSRIDTLGGSSLAMQIEKYRHSPGGITHDAREKLQKWVCHLR